MFCRCPGQNLKLNTVHFDLRRNTMLNINLDSITSTQARPFFFEMVQIIHKFLGPIDLYSFLNEYDNVQCSCYPNSNLGGLQRNFRLRQIESELCSRHRFFVSNRRRAGKSCITGRKKRGQEGRCRNLFISAFWRFLGGSHLAEVLSSCFVSETQLVCARMAGDGM